jgi:trimeric autotransporter adhesin
VCILSLQVSAQQWQTSGNSTVPGDFLGTTNAQPLDFKTNNTPRATITSAGLFGINVTNPQHQLDVNGNAIHLTALNNVQSSGYMMNGKMILTQLIYGNLFLGEDAGLNTQLNSTGSGQNTFLGFNAGITNTSGGNNTFTGHKAGFSNNTGYNNTFTGVRSGYNTTSGFENTFIGLYAGQANTTGKQNTYLGAYTDHNAVSTGSLNTFTGYNAGRNLTSGSENTISGAEAARAITMGNFNVITGRQAGYFLTTGDNNVFIGYKAGYTMVGNAKNTCVGNEAGWNLIGNENTFLGHQATSPTQNIGNATGIGFQAVPIASNTMILGNNSVNVGIGLSGNPSGPQAKLEINASTINTSGLRFRQLTSISPTITNPGPGCEWQR